MKQIPSLDELLGVNSHEVKDTLLFTFGKESESPFDDPDIVLPSTINNLYERLGLDNFEENTASIKQAYHRQVLIWHPDRNHGHEDEAKPEFVAIDKAYQTLSNPTTRSIYNSKLRQELKGKEKSETWQSTTNNTGKTTSNAERASRTARSYVTIKKLDDLFTPEQRAKVDYLDRLVDKGGFYLSDRGDVLSWNMGKDCNHCSKNFSDRPLQLNYKNSSMPFSEFAAHLFLAHGTRAMIMDIMGYAPKSDSEESKLNTSCSFIDIMYKKLNITLPATEITAKTE